MNLSAGRHVDKANKFCLLIHPIMYLSRRSELLISCWVLWDCQRKSPWVKGTKKYFQIQLYHGNLGVCSYLFHQRCIQNCYVSLQCLKSALDVFFCFWHLRRVRKKKKISRLMMQCYLLFVHYLSQRLCFQIKKQRKKTKMYQYHVQVFFTFSGHAQRHFLSEFYLFIIFFQASADISSQFIFLRDPISENTKV